MRIATARSALTLMLATCLGVLQPVTALAWLYPEHRDITVLAVQRLEPAPRALLEQLWSEARAGHEARLCAQLVDTAPGNPACIDYAAWPAIAGDHSCSARDLLSTVLDTPWILDVARISARLKRQLATATRRDQRINAMRGSDIELQRADLNYATRAGSNNVHFLLARPDVDIEPEAYARLVLGPGAELNAMGAYVWYHLRALAKAARLAHGDLAPAARAQVALAALADEAFALHFLEDSFAAGHMAGTWGKAAVRKGTHDYYNERGLEMVTWSGHRFVAQGDAYMRPQDAERAATAVRDSLAQLIGALDGKADTDAAADGFAETEPEAFDVCQQSHFPALAGTVADMRALVPIIVQTPVPALGPGPGELPRFHAELGPFVGVSAAVRGVALAGGFGSTQTGVSTTGGLEGAVRVGLGLEGVLNEAGDGLVFAEAGLRQDASTLGAATVPGRGAITARLRVPFWLIPGDLVLAAPVLASVLAANVAEDGRAGGQRWPHPLAGRHRHPYWPLPVRARTRGGPELLSLPSERPHAHSDPRGGADQRHPRRTPLAAGGAAHSRVSSLPLFRAGPELQSGGSVLCRIRHAAPVLGRLPGGCPEAGAADDRARGHPGGVRLAILPAIEVEGTTRPNTSRRV